MDQVRTMRSELVLIDREALLGELRQGFDAETAEVLLRVLDTCRAAGAETVNVAAILTP